MEGAKLIAHKGAQLVTREDLKNYPAPEFTATWKPVSHLQLVETLSQVMADRGLHITREQFAVQNAKLFGTFNTEKPLPLLRPFAPRRVWASSWRRSSSLL